MRQDPTAKSLDSAPERLCDVCHRELKQHAARLSRPGQLALDRARSHLARGEISDARNHFVRTLWSGRDDAQILRGFAVAFFEARQYNESISIMRYALKLNHSPRQVPLEGAFHQAVEQILGEGAERFEERAAGLLFPSNLKDISEFLDRPDVEE